MRLFVIKKPIIKKNLNMRLFIMETQIILNGPFHTKDTSDSFERKKMVN